MRLVGQELTGIVALSGAALLGGLVLGHEAAFVLAAVAYITWHALNIVRLVWWLRRGRFRAPLSWGLWEGIFDSLQAVQLRNRRRKRALLELLRQLRELAASIPDGIVLLDKRARIRWFNGAAERLLGLRWPRDSLAAMVDLVDQPVLGDQLTIGGDPRPVEMLSPINGAVMLRVEISEIRGTDQRLLVARDITKTYNVERSRREFAANVSHELRTPLTVFRGYLEVLEDFAAENSELERPIQLLAQQSDRMNELVEDLLDLSRLDYTDRPTTEQPVCVSDLLNAIIDEARGLEAAHGREIEVDLDPALWLTGDESALRAAFTNLIVNAFKHTPKGTRVRVGWASVDEGCAMRVSDEGVGIAAYHLPRLTERFYRVDPGRAREKGGTGLGLAIAKHVVERHGGELRIASTPGKGSVFACHFPVTAMTSAPKGV